MSDEVWGARLANPESRIINVPLALPMGRRIITLRSTCIGPATRHSSKYVLWMYLGGLSCKIFGRSARAFVFSRRGLGGT